MSDFDREVLVGVFLPSNPEDWELCGIEYGDIIEVGYHNDDGECVDEETEHLWCQTWGTWNPTMLDFLTADHITILGKHLDWRSPQYRALSPEILQAAEQLLEKVESVNA